MKFIKDQMASVSAGLKISEGGLVLQKSLTRGKYIRAVNYHCTPEGTAENFERQLSFLSERFVSVDERALGEFFSSRVWKAKRPGIVITFDDGLRSNYEVAAPLLEKYGFKGWFMIPPGFVETEPDSQEQYASDNHIRDRNGKATKRISMSWPELRDLVDRGHEVCSHTYNHVRLSESVSYTDARYEIEGSKSLLETKLNKKVNSFAWVGGEEINYSRISAELIRDCGYKYSFNSNAGHIVESTSPLKLGRINLESDYSIELVALQLSGLIDCLYSLKRRRINHKALG